MTEYILAIGPLLLAPISSSHLQNLFQWPEPMVKLPHQSTIPQTYPSSELLASISQPNPSPSRPGPMLPYPNQVLPTQLLKLSQARSPPIPRHRNYLQPSIQRNPPPHIPHTTYLSHPKSPSPTLQTITPALKPPSSNPLSPSKPRKARPTK